jgi:hypothetical protein
MKIDRRQKIFFGLLGLAVAALGIDHVFSGETTAAGSPAAVVPSAKVDQAATNAGSSGAIITPTASGQTATIVGSEITGRLDSWANLHPIQYSELSDAFVPSPIFTVMVKPKQIIAHDDQFEAKFQQKYHVKAIFLDQHGGHVLINDRVLRVGQAIGGMQLTTLDGKTAHFSGQGREVSLTLEAELDIAGSE